VPAVGLRRAVAVRESGHAEPFDEVAVAANVPRATRNAHHATRNVQRATRNVHMQRTTCDVMMQRAMRNEAAIAASYADTHAMPPPIDTRAAVSVDRGCTAWPIRPGSRRP
jgi:hypothetical protein